MPQTLPQRLYLLCYTVDKGKFELDSIQGRGQLLRAGALTELALAGLIGTEGGKVLRLPAAPPPEPFAAQVWHDLPTEKPKNWLRFLHNKAHLAETPVRDQLVADGAVGVTRTKVLGVLPADRVVVHEPERVAALQKTVRAAVAPGADPAALPFDELTMAVLAAEVEVTSVFARKELREHKAAHEELAARFDKVVPGLRKALRDSYLSSRAVGGGWSA
ncbi:GPP34 family phosphoprotein [Streptomyces sp. Z26]|uniref:GOLPH3/VPS74 family protein n=1 Tax=Streptomyces sp. Z26 TaxID=2500177 RepID=UPI000EF1431E|nr:GPP34 family phosphoprotein [Streptomyces sp. Z26]RLL68032.1 GPP34 family phosphoprotein [Streptomyces sp. Z26]